MRTLVLLVLSLAPTLALAKGPLPAPVLRTDQHVYTVPEGFQPPGVGQAGIDQLNGELKRLHFRTKVVFVERLPDLDAEQHDWARREGFRGDSNTLRVEVATARLAEDWAQSQPDQFNAGTDNVFILSFEPRKFAWTPGVRWRTDLGVTP